jgi:hypothetical protein
LVREAGFGSPVKNDEKGGFEAPGGTGWANPSKYSSGSGAF